MKTRTLMAMALFALAVSPGWAQKPAVVMGNEAGWQKIGETVASFKSQDESIAVLGADEFAAIKIKVDDAPLHIERLQVFYESGDMEEIDVKKRIQAGEESEVFKLEHPDRDIQKVAFTYSTLPNADGDKAEVELFGLKTGNEGESNAYRDDADRAADKAERKADEARKDIKRESRETRRDINRKADRTEDKIDRRADRTENDVERAADKTGDAISEAAAKTAAEIDDPRHETKVGPDGQTIYIGDDARLYYINEKGTRVYVRKSQLKDKPEKE
jgi:hypothetical protein